MLRHRTYPSGGVKRIAVLALTAVIVVALSLVLTCSAMDIPLMQPKLENATVDPGTSGKWDQSFTYAVNCIFYDTVNITLEVYNLSLHDWTAIGDRTYNGTGEWQTLTWEDLKICSGKCEGTSSYRFKYNGSILLTESGPTIAPPTPTLLPPTVQVFKNASVKPAYGHYNDSFTYSVFAQLNQTTNITLEVFDISSYEWKEAGENQSYTETGEWQLLSWADVTNVSAVDSAGVASYRFLFFVAGERRESEVFYGPELGLYPTPTPTPTVIYSGGGGGGGGGLTWRKLLSDEKLMGELAEKLGGFNISRDGGGVAINPPELINATVTPENGSWHQSYDYLVEVEHPDRADMWLTLEVYCPGQRENYTISTQRVWLYDDANIARVEWPSVNVFNEEDVRANESPGYYIHYNDGCNKDIWGGFPGPELYFPPVLTDPSVSPAEGTYKEQFVYKVDVMDEEGDNLNVTLYILDSEGSEIYNDTHVINGSEAKGGKTVSWTYRFTEEAAADSEFRYYFCATDGIVSNTTGVRVGPYIKHSEFSLLWIILAVIGGLAVVIGLLWLGYKRYFRREIEEEIV
jgi:hypothetical protein